MVQEVSPKEPQKPAKMPDDMLNLFATEVAEDSSLGKFAASLEDIEAADILKNALDVREKLKGKRR